MNYHVVTVGEDIYHHGIKGQKWGVRRFQNKDGSLTKAGRERYGYDTSMTGIKEKLSKVKYAVQEGAKGSPVGNQNCQLCTWAVEAYFRGKNVIPRPVHSPRDVIFSKNGYDIVRGAQIQKVLNRTDMLNKVVEAGDGSRFYTHVNWRGTEGGHEFVLTNLGGKVYVIDAQAGFIGSVNSATGRSYTDGVNYQRSFVSRMDDKPLNESLLKLNDRKYMTEWNSDEDVPYMKANNMLAPGDEEYLRKVKIL